MCGHGYQWPFDDEPTPPQRIAPTTDTFREGREIATQLVQIKARLGQLRLFKTMHALDHATRAIGYELEEIAPTAQGGE